MNEMKVIELLQELKALVLGKKVEKYYDLKQASEMTNLSISTIRRAIKENQLQCSRKMGKILLTEDQIQRWINN